MSLYNFISKLPIQKQLYIGGLSIFFFIFVFSIALVILNISLLSYDSYKEYISELENYEDDELKEYFKLIDFENTCFVEALRFGVQWSRNHFEMLSEHSNKDIIFKNLDKYKEILFDTVDFSKPLIDSTINQNHNNNYQIIKSNALFGRELIIADDEADREKFDFKYCLSKYIPKIDESEIDVIKKKLILIYPLVNYMFKTQSRYYNNYKFTKFNFDFPTFSFYYPFYKSKVNKTFNFNTYMQSSAYFIKYLVQNFKSHLLMKNLSYLDVKILRDVYIRNPMIAFELSFNVKRPYIFDINSSAHVTSISLEYVSNDVTLQSLWDNHIKQRKSTFYADIDTRIFDFLTSMHNNKVKGLIPLAFNEKNFGVLLYNNCLKVIREYENLDRNTTYTDDLIEKTNKDTNYFDKSLVDIRSCLKYPLLSETIMGITKNSTYEFSRKNKIQYNNNVKVKTYKIDTPGIYTRLMYSLDYIINYSAGLFIMKKDEYINMEKKFLYSKFSNKIIFSVIFTLLIWLICLMIIVYNIYRLNHEFNNSIIILVEIINSVNKEGSISGENEENFMRKMNKIEFKYDEEIENFLDNCKELIIKSTQISKEIKSENKKENMIFSQESKVKSKQITYDEFTEVKRNNLIFENNENDSKKDFEAAFKQNHLNKRIEERDSQQKNSLNKLFAYYNKSLKIMNEFKEQ